MKKTYLSLIVLAILILAGAGYILLYEDNKDQIKNNSGDISSEIQLEGHKVDQSVIDELESTSKEPSFLITTSYNEDSIKNTSHLVSLSGERLSDDFEHEFYFYSPVDSELRNGYLLDYLKKDSGLNLYIKNIYDGKEYQLAVIETKENEEVNGYGFSLDGTSVYVSLFEQYSPTNYVNGYSDQIINSRIIQYFFNTGDIKEVYSLQDTYEASGFIKGVEDYFLFNKYLTEANSSAVYRNMQGVEMPILIDYYSVYLVSPDKSKILFVVTNQMDGRFHVNKLKMFDVSNGLVVDEVAFNNSELKTSPDTTWPNRTEMTDVAWSSDSKSLIFLKRTFANNDVDNADVDILKLDIENNIVTTLASLRTEFFSANQILGEVNGVVYVNGAVNGVPQTRKFPENSVVFEENTAAALIY